MCGFVRGWIGWFYSRARSLGWLEEGVVMGEVGVGVCYSVDYSFFLGEVVVAEVLSRGCDI